MDAIAGMLMRPDLVASAVVQSHLVELLAYMLSGAQRSRGKCLILHRRSIIIIWTHMVYFDSVNYSPVPRVAEASDC